MSTTKATNDDGGKGGGILEKMENDCMSISEHLEALKVMVTTRASSTACCSEDAGFFMIVAASLEYMSKRMVDDFHERLLALKGGAE